MDPVRERSLRASAERLIITEFGLANWLAQTYKLDLSEMARIRPPYLSNGAYEEIKQLLAGQTGFKDEPTSIPGHLMVQHVVKVLAKEGITVVAGDGKQSDNVRQRQTF